MRPHIFFGWRIDDKDLKIDKKFKGSFNESLGLSDRLCPVCNAHLKEMDMRYICLKGCHLPKSTMEKFDKLMGEAYEKVK